MEDCSFNTFTKVFNGVWNASSLVQDLNSSLRVHFLQHYTTNASLSVSQSLSLSVFLSLSLSLYIYIYIYTYIYIIWDVQGVLEKAISFCNHEKFQKIWYHLRCSVCFRKKKWNTLWLQNDIGFSKTLSLSVSLSLSLSLYIYIYVF